MNQDNDFQQYGFDHYDQVPLRRRGVVERVFGGSAANMLRSPLIATILFLVVGVGIAGLVISSMSDSGNEAEVPVVKADTFAYKEAPSEPGGMDIENQGSTIYMSMRDEKTQESAPIENLLEEAPAEKLESFARQVEEAVQEEEAAAAEQVEKAKPAKREETVAKIENLLESAEDKAVEKVADVKAASEAAAPAQAQAVEVSKEEPTPSRVEPPKMAITHSAGSNPETLEFVRSVLDKKDGKVVLDAPATRDHTASDVASGAASIEPAVGSQVGVAIKPGDYFVQLASVTSASGAEGEWGKIQKAFPTLLTNVDHRVKQADLGERGVYYRIQAGPMSKESANALCESIKAEKPGGCLVTK